MTLQRSFRLAGLFASLMVSAAFSQEDSAAAVRASDGAYSDDQARDGEGTYKKNCTSCHSPAAYTGAVFRRVWSGHSAYELWEQIRTTMPQNNPGKLKPEQYADIVAYLLKLNGYPSGDAALPADPERLKRVEIDARPKPTQ